MRGGEREFELLILRVNGTDQDAETRKAKIDEHKDDQLKKQKEGKGHWKGELGSNSEAAVGFFLFFLIGWLVGERVMMGADDVFWLDQGGSRGDYGRGARY